MFLYFALTLLGFFLLILYRYCKIVQESQLTEVIEHILITVVRKVGDTGHVQTSRLVWGTQVYVAKVVRFLIPSERGPPFYDCPKR